MAYMISYGQFGQTRSKPPKLLELAQTMETDWNQVFKSHFVLNSSKNYFLSVEQIDFIRMSNLDNTTLMIKCWLQVFCVWLKDLVILDNWMTG